MSDIIELINIDRIFWQEGYGFKLALTSSRCYLLDFSEYNGESNIVHVSQQDILKEVLSPESLYLRKLHNDRVNFYSQQQDEYYNKLHDKETGLNKIFDNEKDKN